MAATDNILFEEPNLLREPYLVYWGDDGVEVEAYLDQKVITIGRSLQNSICRKGGLMTEVSHCSIRTSTDDKHQSKAWLTDSSTNGTWLNDVKMEMGKEVPLKLGSTIKIPTLQKRKVDEEDKEGFIYWTLSLFDAKTRVASQPKTEGSFTFQYDLVTRMLLVLHGNQTYKKIVLTKTERKLVEYMNSRNVANSGTPTFCNFKELIELLWDKKQIKTSEDVNHYVCSIRKKVRIEDLGAQIFNNTHGEGITLYVNNEGHKESHPLKEPMKVRGHP